MTREILFRGKRLDNGEWIESGSLIRARDEGTGNFLVFLGSAQPAVHIFNRDGNLVSVTSLAECFCCEVDPSTVGQFTGLTANGKKIFEGDIVKPLRYASSINSTELVEYDGGGFSPFAIPGWECTIEPHNVTVIGNKWDNPELLEDEG